MSITSSPVNSPTNSSQSDILQVKSHILVKILLNTLSVLVLRIFTT